MQLIKYRIQYRMRRAMHSRLVYLVVFASYYVLVEGQNFFTQLYPYITFKSGVFLTPSTNQKT